MSLPVPFQSALPEVYAGSALGAYGAVPLDFSAPAEDPDTLWLSISEPVRKRATDRSGDILAWWASKEPGRDRPSAVVLGEHGLVTIAAVEKVYELNVVRLDPASFRTFEVTGVSNPEGGQREAPEMPFEGQMELLVRNLPAQAQRHLQAPYHHGSGMVRYGSFYLKWDRPLGTELQVWAYAFGSVRLVFVSGSRFGRHGEPESRGTWQLTCRSAVIVAGKS